MIKCNVRKLHQYNRFKNVTLELSPTKIVLYFSDQTFSILNHEVVSYKILGKNIYIELLGPKNNLNIVVTPYKKDQIHIIEHHIAKYFQENIKMTTNPLFL